MDDMPSLGTKFTEVFMQKKQEKWEGDTSATKAFVKSIIINHPRREESLDTVYLHRTVRGLYRTRVPVP